MKLAHILGVHAMRRVPPAKLLLDAPEMNDKPIPLPISRNFFNLLTVLAFLQNSS